MFKHTADYVKINTKQDLAKLANEVGTSSDALLQYFGVTYERLRGRFVYIRASKGDKTMTLLVGKYTSEKVVAVVDERTDAEREATKRANFAGWLLSKRKYNYTHVRGIALDNITFVQWENDLYKY